MPEVLNPACVQIEYINGELWGNVWQTECIARINVTTGRVTHWMLLTGLRDKLLKRSTTQAGLLDVLNGESQTAHYMWCVM
jgi:glutamine cyclotransferase